MTGQESGSTAEQREEELLHGFTVYDQCVDVVSAIEWLFTEVGGLKETVVHFERFPKVQANGSALTPDFTVTFNDGCGVVGEIARIALHENSVDKLCKQIARYDTMEALPAVRGLGPVKTVDVLLLTPAQTGLNAVRRIIKERMLVDAHPYKPKRPPCISQFSRDGSKYIFQRLPDPVNGTLERTNRAPNIVDRLDNDLPVAAHRFVNIKARRAFVNDSPPPLYLATHLWARTWPNLYGGYPQTGFTVDVDETSKALREQYGTGRKTDVRHALELLKLAGLAQPQPDGKWKVSTALLGRRGERDVHIQIASRAAKEAGLRTRQSRVRMIRNPQQDTLF